MPDEDRLKRGTELLISRIEQIPVLIKRIEILENEVAEIKKEIK